MTSTALARLQEMYDSAMNQPLPPGPVSPRALDPRLHRYQCDAVDHMYANPRAGLFLEMGLGKTAATLQALTPNHLPVLVIAPKRVAEQVWPTELKIWRPDLTMAVAAGTPVKRQAAIGSGADIVVIGRDNVKDIPVGKFKTVVLDELSSFKNRSSQRWKIVKKVTDAASFVWGLTGTPSPNGLMDLWAQVYLLDSGARLGRTLTTFRRRYFHAGRQLPNGVVIEWILQEGAQQRIEEAISDICLSMKSADHLDLPPLTFNPVWVPLSHHTKKIYDQMVTTLVVDQDHTASSPGVLTGKLSQITAGFLYADETKAVTRFHTEKVAAVEETIEGTGSPVLVFYRFTEERDALLRALPQARRIEEKGVIDEWNRGEVPVLIAHPASAGHGLNLQHGGSTIVWSTLPWSLEEYAQGNARLARQGQTKPVVAHLLLSPGTVDEAILARLQDKVSVQDALMMALKRSN